MRLVQFSLKAVGWYRDLKEQLHLMQYPEHYRLFGDVDPEAQLWTLDQRVVDAFDWLEQKLLEAQPLAEIFVASPSFIICGQTYLGLAFHEYALRKYRSFFFTNRLFVSEGVFKQIYVPKNIDFQCEPGLVYERLKNHVKGICTVNFSKDLSIAGENPLQGSLDLAYHAYRWERDHREVFQFPT